MRWASGLKEISAEQPTALDTHVQGPSQSLWMPTRID